MQNANLHRIDLNLLVALDALLAERSVTGAGLRLGLSQPALSRVLARLREQFGDPLLVKEGRRMVPTPRALALAAPVHDLLTQAALLVRPERFDPAGAQGVVRVFATDAATETAIVPWVEAVARAAPRLSFQVLAMAADVPAALARAEADFAIDVYPVVGEGFHVRHLFQDRLVCVLRRGHPAARGRFTRARYQALRHIQVTGTGGGGHALETELARLGIQRDIVFRSPNFATAPYIASVTDWARTIPSTRAKRSAKRFPLTILPLPFALRAIPLSVLWHDRTALSPLHAWLRDMLLGQFPGDRTPH